MVNLDEGQEPFIWSLEAAGRSDVGRVRQHNEDSILIARELGLYAVADGMGGHSAGDVASKIVVDSMRDICMRDNFEPPIDTTGDEVLSRPAIARFLVATIVECNRRIFEESGRCMTEGGMGSTVVAGLFDAPSSTLHVVHAGDSRCYRLRGEEMEPLTVDHSIRNEALRLNPDLPDDVLAQLPGNLVTRALGSADTVVPEWTMFKVQDGDRFLFCSDGLSGEVTDEQMAAVVAASSNLEAASKQLIELANLAGGKDNISVVLVEARHGRSFSSGLLDDAEEPDQDTQPSMVPGDEDGGFAFEPKRPEDVVPADVVARSPERLSEAPEADIWPEQTSGEHGSDSDLPEPPTPSELHEALTPGELMGSAMLLESEEPPTPVDLDASPSFGELPEPPTPKAPPEASDERTSLESVGRQQDVALSTSPHPANADAGDRGKAKLDPGEAASVANDEEAYTSPDWNESDQSDLPEPPPGF
jgi:PPM family protein phosphatase